MAHHLAPHARRDPGPSPLVQDLLGLAPIRKFVTAMSGTVSAAANQGPGCTITLCLPRA